MRSGSQPTHLAFAAFAAFGCGAARDNTQLEHSRIVYGTDGRVEVYEAPPEAQARAKQSVVALVADTFLDAQGRLSPATPTLAEQENVCQSERFSSQPSAAFCTGVLIDWDLVLTADHCTRLYALQDFSIVFDYFYAAPGVLDLTSSARVHAAEIVVERLDPAGADPSEDFAVLRLAQSVLPPRTPSPVLLRTPLAVGEPLLSISTNGGVPLKVDASGSVTDPRDSSLDYFVADTDTSKGSSGGGAFDRNGNLAGVLARGGADLSLTDAGCAAMSDSTATQADEQYTYASTAITALCDKDKSSALCRGTCSEPCVASPMQRDAAGGCMFSPRAPRNTLLTQLFVVFTAVGFALRGARRSSRLTPQND